MKWQVWGDNPIPILDGVDEETAKTFVQTDQRPELYIQNEEGDEFEYDKARNLWVEL